MKVTMLCANGTSNRLKSIIDQTTTILKELEVEVEHIQLDTLPYYKEGELSPLAQVIANKIQDSRGVIAITTVHVAGMHSSMQGFFEHMEGYGAQISQVPMLAITHTKGLGERQAAYQMLQAWNVIGGSDGGYTSINTNMLSEDVEHIIEKSIEGFYRVLRQERIPQICSEAYVLKYTQDSLDGQAIQGVDNEVGKEVVKHINLSTQEQNIQEFAGLLRQQIGHTTEEFVPTNTTTYSNPLMSNQNNRRENNDLSRLPHYFLAQYANDLELSVQYIVTNSRQQGYIIIKEGDCTYEEGNLMSAMLEITLTEEMLDTLINKKITYQKAFMVGKIKVRGNFVLLPKLDQIFKAV